MYIHVNDNYKWFLDRKGGYQRLRGATGGSPEKLYRFSMLNMAIHEIGHTLGERVDSRVCQHNKRHVRRTSSLESEHERDASVVVGRGDH